MSTSAVSSSSLNQSLQQYFQTRHADLKQLDNALSSGDLSGAQTAYNNITTLGQSGPFANGQPFAIAQREQDFQTVGQALQNGDLAQAQSAFDALGNTFVQHGVTDPTAPSAGGSGSSSAGPEIVLNLSGGNTGAPEQVTINISPASSGGGEQVSLSVGNQGSNSQEITFNLGANSNEQIVLNLLGASPSTGGSSSTNAGASAGLSVSA